MAPSNHVASPIVLLHGFTQSGRAWRHVTGRLEDQGFLVRTPDLAGHGTAPLPERDLAHEANRIATVHGRASYVGYSLGGRIALHIALARPELVAALVLVGATPGIEDDAERAERRRTDEELARELLAGGDPGLASFIDRWLSGPLFAHLDEEHADRGSRLGNSAAGLAASLRCHGTGDQESVWPRLSTLEMPVLVLAGASDTKFSAIGEQMAQAIGANATFRTIDGSGHAVPLERPAELASEVAHFLRAVA